MDENFHQEVLKAHERIKQYVRRTPLERSYPLEIGTSSKVYIKFESEQLTGSFKLRGAFNKCLLLKERAKAAGQDNVTFVTASSGNHGMACTVAMQTLHISGRIFVPGYTSQAKLDMLKMMGAQVEIYGDDCLDTELRARRTAEEKHCVYISPYNDLEIVAGQGTIGVEIYSELPEVDVVMATVGGGGLLGGIAAYMKAVKPSIKIIGCQPVNSAVMFHSVKAGKILSDMESDETLSDGSAGSIEENAVTFELCRKYVDDWQLVSEKDIADAVYFMMEQHHKIIEGAAGVAIAAYHKLKDQLHGKTVAIVACGANISMAVLTKIITSKGRP